MDARIALLSGAAFLGVVGFGIVAAQRSDGPAGTTDGTGLQVPVAGSGDALVTATRWDDDDDHEEEHHRSGEHEREHDEDEDDD